MDENKVNDTEETIEEFIDYTELGKRIAKRRKVLDLTQEQLAESVDIGYPFMSNIERGVSGPSFKTFLKLAKVLDVTPDYLLLGIDKKFRNDDLEEVKALLYRCDDKKIHTIKEFIRWYTDQEV